MRGLGILISIEGKRPVTVGVLLEGVAESCSGEEVYRHSGHAQDDLPEMLRSLADDLDSQLPLLNPNAVVIHSADWHPARPPSPIRQMAEGVVAAVARKHVQKVEVLNGKQIGNRMKLGKEAVESNAASILGQELKVSGSAALAALSIAESG